MSRFTQVILIVLLCLTLSDTRIQAQPFVRVQVSALVVLEFDGSTMIVKSLQPSGELLMLAEIPNTTLVGSDVQTVWKVYTTGHLAVSPSGQLIAYTGFSTDGNALFIYDVNAGTLEQYTITSAALKPKWSPDESAILLYTPFPYFDVIYGDVTTLPDDHIFELVTRTLIQLTSTSNFIEHEWQWEADSEHLIYIGGRSNRNQIFRVSRDGESVQQLTQFTEENPKKLCSLQHFDERWYFIAAETCSDPVRQLQDELYSITLNQETKLEFSVFDWLNLDTPSDFPGMAMSINAYFWQEDGTLVILLLGIPTPSFFVARPGPNAEFSIITVIPDNISEQYVFVTEIDDNVFFRRFSLEGTQILRFDLASGAFTDEYSVAGRTCHFAVTSDRNLLAVVSNGLNCNSSEAEFTQVMILEPEMLTPLRQFDLDPQNSAIGE